MDGTPRPRHCRGVRPAALTAIAVVALGAPGRADKLAPDAFRVSWNLATIGTLDYGRSSEDTGFYVNFNHIF
jgi:hypothetical protein